MKDILIEIFYCLYNALNNNVSFVNSRETSKVRVHHNLNQYRPLMNKDKSTKIKNTCFGTIVNDIFVKIKGGKL